MVRSLKNPKKAKRKNKVHALFSLIMLIYSVCGICESMESASRDPKMEKVLLQLLSHQFPQKCGNRAWINWKMTKSFNVILQLTTLFMPSMLVGPV